MSRSALSENERITLSTKRIEALHDGVFAIVMTLMVFEIKVPTLHSSAEITTELFGLLPVFLSYVISFVNLGIYWIGQHIQQHYIVASDRVFAWINILFLMLISLLPFSSAMLGEHSDVQLSYIMYGTNLIAIGLVSGWSWCYATHHHRLTEHSINPTFVRAVKRRILVGPIVCVLAIIASFFTMRLSLLLYVLILPYYIFPGRIDKIWQREAVPHHD